MILDIVLFILGFVFLLKGADLLVDGSSSIAQKLGVPTLVIGLTIVAFGTSLPELIISALAALNGNADIAMGNVIGSNISNTLLILGATAMITPLLVKKSTINKEIPLALLAILAVGILVNGPLINGEGFSGLDRTGGLILLLFFVIFIYYTFGISKIKKRKVSLKVDEAEPKTYHPAISTLMIGGGLVALFLGGKWIVGGAEVIAGALGMSQALIALTVVALGTSLPELAASVVAAKKGYADMAVGTVVGSNIFNLLWILGLSAVIHPIGYNPILNVDMIILIAITIILLFLIYIGKRDVITRWEGLVLLTLYAGYIGFLALRG